MKHMVANSAYTTHAKLELPSWRVILNAGVVVIIIKQFSGLSDYDAQDLEEFQEAILRGCDFNKDGKINKKELTMILLALAKHAQEDDVK
ncbi:UNVERIFIED_CONTAM: Cbp53E [Trichonephila clavipes]